MSSLRMRFLQGQALNYSFTAINAVNTPWDLSEEDYLVLKVYERFVSGIVEVHSVNLLESVGGDWSLGQIVIDAVIPDLATNKIYALRIHTSTDILIIDGTIQAVLDPWLINEPSPYRAEGAEPGEGVDIDDCNECGSFPISLPERTLNGDFYRNLILNGGMIYAEDNDVAVTSSYQDPIRGVKARITGSGFSGEIRQRSDDLFGNTGWHLSLANVSVDNTTSIIRIRFDINAADAVSLMNTSSVFSCLVDHSHTSALPFRLEMRKCNTLNSFDDTELVYLSDPVMVDPNDPTILSHSVLDNGDTSNGLTVFIRCTPGMISNRRFRFTDVQLEKGNLRTNFQTLRYNVIKAYYESLANNFYIENFEITNEMLENITITQSMLGENSIENFQLANNSVNTGNLVNQAVTSSKLATDQRMTFSNIHSVITQDSAHNIGTTGSIRIGNFIIKWGRVEQTSSSPTRNVSFPTAFPNAALCAFAQKYSEISDANANQTNATHVNNLTNTGMRVNVADNGPWPNTGVYWVAFGW